MGKDLQTSQKEKIRDFLARRGRDTIDIMREFAVLILLVQKADGLYFLFEKRAATIKQPGDVCFPGGRLEAGESVEACALRETYEEIGLRHIEILGKYGTQYELASIAMHAVVGIVPEAELKNLRLSEAEVAEVFTVPVRFLPKPSRISTSRTSCRTRRVFLMRCWASAVITSGAWAISRS